MHPQTFFYQRLIGRTAVRPYTRNLGQPIFETLSKAHGSDCALPREVAILTTEIGDCPRFLSENPVEDGKKESSLVELKRARH